MPINIRNTRLYTYIETMNSSERKIQDVSLILKDFLKVIKVVSMYPEDNPLPQSLRRSFAEKMEAIVDDHGDIQITVRKDCLHFEGTTVFENRSKEENLAGILYDAGITEITLKGGLEVLEVYKLLDVIKIYLNTPDKSQDLAAMIWEASICGITLRTLEDVALSEYDHSFNIQEYVSSGGASSDNQSVFGSEPGSGYQDIFIRDEDSGKYDSSQLISSDEFEPGQIAFDAEMGPVTEEAQLQPIPTGVNHPPSDGHYQPSGDSSGGTLQYNDLEGTPSDGVASDLSAATEALGFGDGGQASSTKTIPDSALILNDEFKLSEEEEQVIRELIDQDSEFEPYTSTLELLKEMLRQETELPGFGETVTICERIMGEFIRNGRLVEAGALLEHLKKLEPRVRKEKKLWADRLKDAYIAAGSRERLESLAESLNTQPSIGVVELRKYLNNFGWEALAGIADMVGHLEHHQHRQSVLDLLAERGKNNLDILARGVFDKSPDVVRNAMSILAQVADDRALSYLDKIVQHPDDQLRSELIGLLKECPNENALAILEKAVSDSEPEIRRAAIRAIVTHSRPAAF